MKNCFELLKFSFAARFPATCKMEARWMFGHLDLNTDGILSSQELYELEHDQVIYENCFSLHKIKPEKKYNFFFDRMKNASNHSLTRAIWIRTTSLTHANGAVALRRPIVRVLL